MMVGPREVRGRYEGEVTYLTVGRQFAKLGFTLRAEVAALFQHLMTMEEGEIGEGGKKPKEKRKMEER